MTAAANSDSGDPRSGGGRRRLVIAAGVAAAVVAAGAFVLRGGDGAEDGAAGSQAVATTSIRQQDLVETEEVDGTLGYSDVRTVVGRRPGTVTWTPKSGSVVKTNERLYEIDGSAVYLFDGSYPAYRALRPGLSGDDVRQLERNLRRHGFDDARAMDVDGSWDAGTTAALKRWQGRKGIAQDGTLEPGRIVFQPSARRIGTIMMPAGSSVPGGAALMATTSTKRIVAVDLETTKQDLAAEGAGVSVELPGANRVAGTIARVGKVAQQKPTPQEEDPPATIKVLIKLAESSGTGLDLAPVDVRFEKERAKDVLTVPVTALLARAGGRFAVEIRDGDGRRTVPVETGLYTDSFVEIEGRGLREGLTVSNAEI